MVDYVVDRSLAFVDRRHLSEETQQSIKAALTVAIPNTQDTIDLYSIIHPFWILPRFFAQRLFGLAHRKKSQVTMETWPENCFSTKLPLDLARNQPAIFEKVVLYLRKHDSGVLTIPPGSGKTCLAIHIAVHFQVKTLILVTQHQLMEQWEASLRQFVHEKSSDRYPLKVGFICGKRWEVDGCQFVIGMVQTLLSRLAKKTVSPQDFSTFGLTLYDECHHLAAPTFSKILPFTASAKNLALSATPDRSDHLEAIFHMYIGPIIYKDPSAINAYGRHTVIQALQLSGLGLCPKTSSAGRLDMVHLLKQLGAHPSRNELIVHLLINICKYYPERRCIVLVEHLSHIDTLYDALWSANSQLSLCKLTGKTAGLFRKDPREFSIILATFKLCAEVGQRTILGERLNLMVT
jgi:hypothetical protein